MIVNPRLSLSAGGGIINIDNQADQVENTATVLIGLGGTGIDCIKSIKRQVRERLKPDNPGEPIPEYEHIQFLAVDTDTATKGGILQSTEYFGISNDKIRDVLKRKSLNDSRREMAWLSEIDTIDMGEKEPIPGGVRQVGRYMFMDRSDKFMTAVRNAIQRAKTDLVSMTAPRVYVHLFTGMGGETGSGTFLDVCYLIRKVLQDEGGQLFGYFFMPDVNLDPERIPDSLNHVRSYIKTNGYAAMQELDYCMNLPANGGAFYQEYIGGEMIPWEDAPVDMCHLISAIDTDGNYRSHAYRYAMSATTEYIMDFLTKPYDEDHFGLETHLAIFNPQIAEADGRKQIGVNLKYCTLGGACARLPMREINTYLASKVFEAFSITQDRLPSEADVKDLARQARLISSFEGVNQMYDLIREIVRDGGQDDFLPPMSWREYRSFGASDQNLVQHYESQFAQKKGVVEQNAKGMMDEENQDSLITRIRAELDGCVHDLNRGINFALGVILRSGEGYNLFNIIDGMLKTNQEMREYEAFQISDHLEADYAYRRDLFRNRPNKKAYEAYANAIEQLLRGRHLVNIHDQLDRVLKKLKEQLEDAASGYYTILNQVMGRLITTFDENRKLLEDEGYEAFADDGFVISMIRMSEIKEKLDEEIQTLNMQGVMEEFAVMLQKNKNEWIMQDENKIARLVTDFFVNRIFGANQIFASKTITQFLEDKYGTNQIPVIAENVYNEFMTTLAGRAAPLFPFSQSAMKKIDQPGSRAYVSVPDTSEAIKQGAAKLEEETGGKEITYLVNASALTDRIYAMNCTLAFPLGSYGYGGQYGGQYFNYAISQLGKHYYEGKGGSKWFNNWKELQAIEPYSVHEDELKAGICPKSLVDLYDDSQGLYEKAQKYGLLKGNDVYLLTDETKRRLEGIKTDVLRSKNRAENEVTNRIHILREAIGLLDQLLKSIEIEPCEYSISSIGSQHEDDQERIRKDIFFSSPAIQNMIREQLKLIDSINELRTELEGKVGQAKSADQDLKEYCNALFTGVFTYAGTMISYEKKEFGVSTVMELSKLDNELFPYCNIPLYQAYRTYKEMDQDTRDAIEEAAKAELQSGSERLMTTMKKYKDLLTDDFNGRFQMSADSYPEVYEEATKFIKKLNIEFRSLAAVLNV